MDSERELVRALKQGDRGAFDRFFREHQDRVYGFAAKMVGRDAAEDVTQETFIEACRGIGRFRGESTLKTWLFRIAVHVAHKHRRSRRAEASLEELREAGGDPTGDAVALGERMGRLDGAVARLTNEMREVVLLNKVLGFTYAECAEIVHCPVGTVKSRLSKAMARLREMLGDEEGAA